MTETIASLLKAAEEYRERAHKLALKGDEAAARAEMENSRIFRAAADRRLFGDGGAR